MEKEQTQEKQKENLNLCPPSIPPRFTEKRNHWFSFYNAWRELGERMTTCKEGGNDSIWNKNSQRDAWIIGMFF